MSDVQSAVERARHYFDSDYNRHCCATGHNYVSTAVEILLDLL